MGDVDGDGDLDLVCGNANSSPTLYRNVGGTFEMQPAWSSERTAIDRSYSIALGDVDGDGDLDLVCGNYNASPTLYRNVGGTLRRTYPPGPPGVLTIRRALPWVTSMATATSTSYAGTSI